MSSAPDAAIATMIANLASKTGKTLDEWIAVAKASGEAKHGGIVSFLKSQHGIGHGYANLIAQATLGSATLGAQGIGTAAAKGPAGATGGDSAALDELVDAQYTGAKAGLRPLYDALIEQIRGFGDDVEIAPKKAYVSIRRNKQFAILQPSTATRLDVGINLKGEAPSARLEASGSFNSMVSHRVRVENAKSIDKELIGWLKRAYESA